MRSRVDPARLTAPKRTPTWWTARHSSARERVKDAFRRDWMQTKADFSVGDAQDRLERGSAVRVALFVPKE